MNPIYFLELLLLASIWGASFMFYRIASPELGPVWLVMFRVLVAGLVLLPVLALMGKLRDLRTYWKELFLLGVINSAIPFTLLAYATLYLPAGLTSILNATTPLFAVVVAYFWLKEGLTLGRIAGFFLGFAGVVFLIGWDGIGESASASWAVAAALGASLLYAFGAPYSRLSLGHVTPLVVTTGSQIAAAIFLLPAVPFSAPPASPSPLALWAAVALAVLSTTAAYILFYHLIQQIGSSKALTVTYLVPFFAVLWAYIFLSEPVTPGLAVGGALILIGTAVANEVFGGRAAKSPAQP